MKGTHYSYRSVESFCQSIGFIILFLRLQYILRFVSLRTLRRFSGALAALMRLIFPRLNNEICQTLLAFKPTITELEADLAAKTHTTNIIFQTLFFVTAAYYEPKQFRSFFNTDNFYEKFRTRNKNPGIWLCSHFFGNILILLCSDLAYEMGCRLHGTFSFGSHPLLNYFKRKVFDRFHCDYHVSLNVQEATHTNNSDFNTTLKTGQTSVLIFGDIRFKKSRTDLKYKAGSTHFFANRGFQHSVKKSERQAEVMHLYLTFAEDRFTLHVETMEAKDAVDEYYTTLLPELLNSQMNHWQLWYFGSILSDS